MAEKYLVMFSGGKDSFLTACRILNGGDNVVLLSFNGGSMIAEKNLKHGAERLIQRYGQDKVEYVGIYPTIALIQRLNSNWIHMSQKQLGAEYPNVTNCQFQCLHCQTAMWISAIAYCNAKGIKYIACGYRKSDIFCTGSQEYMYRISKVAQHFNCYIETPVWDVDNDWERDQEMLFNQFVPKVLEPKCLIGRAPLKGLPKEEHDDMIKYFDKNIDSKLIELVNSLTPILKNIKLSDESFTLLEYPYVHKEGEYY